MEGITYIPKCEFDEARKTVYSSWSRKGPRKGKWIELLRELEVGTAFKVPCPIDKKRAMSGSIRQAAKKLGVAVKICYHEEFCFVLKVK